MQSLVLFFIFVFPLLSQQIANYSDHEIKMLEIIGLCSTFKLIYTYMHTNLNTNHVLADKSQAFYTVLTENMVQQIYFYSCSCIIITMTNIKLHSVIICCTVKHCCSQKLFLRNDRNTHQNSMLWCFPCPPVGFVN